MTAPLVKTPKIGRTLERFDLAVCQVAALFTSRDKSLRRLAECKV